MTLTPTKIPGESQMTTLNIPKQLKPELLKRITEVEDKLKALPPIKTQADADAANKVLKESKGLIKLISAERMEITRPINEVIDYIIGMEKSAVSTLAAMTDIKNKNLTDFAREQDRLAEQERERIKKEAADKAASEQARVSCIVELIGKFKKSAYKAISECTLETIDAKIKGLSSLKFDPKIYQEFMDQIEALRPVLLEKLAEKRIDLQRMADLAKIDANKAAQEEIAAKQREKDALENAETAKMNVALNTQMEAELLESTVQGGKSVQRPWVFKGVLSLMDVPFEFLTVDEKKVKEAIKAGRHSIKGLEIIQDIRNVSK